MVVKVGTHLLRSESGGLDLDTMDRLVAQIAVLRKRGIQAILVTSGAVGAGAYAMGWKQPPESITDRQALAAVGQSRLMPLYKTHFREHDITIAQVLLPRDGLDHRQRYLNIRNTLETLLKWNVVPIINENDTVSVEELKFGDNDQLSAKIAAKMEADVLGRVDRRGRGFMTGRLRRKGAKRIPIVFAFVRKTEFPGGGAKAKGGFSLGGMQSKFGRGGDCDPGPGDIDQHQLWARGRYSV
jgi:glutamate 5-kinase